MVPVLYDGIWDEARIRAISVNPEKQEGYVVRLASSFGYGDFKFSVGKYVRANHIQTQQHWFYGRSHHDRNHLRVDIALRID
jgi:hypothetical protein